MSKKTKRLIKSVIVLLVLAAIAISFEVLKQTDLNNLPSSINEQVDHQVTRASNGKKDINYAALPKQAHEVYVLIYKGGPFKYGQDGTVFGNYEKQLPQQAKGYYREYTVTTPKVKHRGARRIVCGGKQPKRPNTCYYTQDHYKTFLKIINAPTTQ